MLHYCWQEFIRKLFIIKSTEEKYYGLAETLQQIIGSTEILCQKAHDHFKNSIVGQKFPTNELKDELKYALSYYQA